MNSIAENNKRIAKNTVFLYIRMLLVMLVGLYASRIILATLGIEDFGIYNIVGGLVAMFSFLNGTLSGATSRFITYELGTNNKENLQNVFSGTLTIHLILALLIFLLSETIGLWFLENKLVIPENRMMAARFVFHLSIITCLISIIQVPYTAAIIAHERMNIYAYVSILEVFLKLGAVYLLVIGNFDKLSFYASLMLCIIILIAFFYFYYGSKIFQECRFKLTTNKEIIKPMLSYSGWDLYGNMSIMARGQGINILLNIFFGASINAASGIATQVQNAVAGFSDNFLIAVRPQIVKNYASNNNNEMQKLIFNASIFSFLLLFIISFPIILECHFILHLWLKEVPDYSIVFCQLTLIFNLISIMFRSIMFSIHATGKMKRISFINGTIYLMVIPISYCFLKAGFSPTIPFVINIILLFVGSISNLYTLHLYIPTFSIVLFLRKVVLVCAVTIFVAIILPLYFRFIFEESWRRFIIVGFTSVLAILTSGYFIAMDKTMRKKIICNIQNKIKKNG